MTLAVTLPGPVITGPGLPGAGPGNIPGAIANSMADGVLGWFVDALGDAVAKVGEQLLHYLDTSSTATFDEGWWSGPRAQEIWGTVVILAGVIMVGCLLLAVIQGVIAGEPMAMVKAAFLEVPISVFGIVVMVAATTLLMGIVDGASAAVLANAGESLGRFFTGVAFSPAPLLTTAVILVVFLIGAFLVWVELIIRASLIYLLVAFSPLLLAARVWPAAKGAFRKLVELGIALIVSKFAIALALALGAAALGGGGAGNLGSPGPNPNDVGTQVGYTMGGLVVGASLMLLASFSPFIILKILPIFEGAVIAQGMAGSPARGAQQAMQTAHYGAALKDRLTGDRGGGGGGSQGGTSTGQDGGQGGGGGGGAAPNVGGGTAGSATPTGGGVAAGGAGGAVPAGGAATAPGPAVAVTAPVGVAVGAAKAGGARVSKTVDAGKVGANDGPTT
ncbi:MAG: hypothetical protein H0V52_06680 [Acidimicrobiia bacterium]|nr:hypothetical protein [Acidimicrobiia bacterium]